MKPAAIAMLNVFGFMLSTEAFATNHPHPCTMLRDSCALSYPAARCDRVYQNAIAHNGFWTVRTYNARRNVWEDWSTNCVP